LVPTMVFLLAFFVVPIANMVKYSFYTQTPEGAMIARFTLENYARFFRGELYRHVLLVTLRISLFTTLAAILLGYPTALVMVRANRRLARAIAIVVISPLLVNVVIRTYGWRIILNRSGVINWLLLRVGLITEPVDILYNEFAIVVGSLHVFFPLMVLPLAAALGRIDVSLEESARTLGANGLQVFRRVTLPLSLPGLAAGVSLVFSLTASSFVTPSLLGGEFAKMLGTLVQEEILAVFNWPFGAAIATVLMGLVLVIVVAYLRIVESRFRGFSMVTQ
jgi:putative spermidine/putrescine transport system permease protein